MIFRFSKQVLYRFYTGFISMVSIYQQIFVKLKVLIVIIEIFV